MTSEERTAQIDRELDRSLGVFDEELRREQAIIAQRRGARDGSGGYGGSGGEGDDAGTAQAGTGVGDTDDGTGAAAGAGSGGEGAAGSGTGEGQGQGRGQSGRSGSSQGEGGGGVGGGPRGGGGPSTVPADIPDGSDDDIVARQLREAAMQETDPELREKLWEEYRNYKKGAK
jgi:hypothetical protein